MKNLLTEELINAIRNVLPAKNSLVESLMELLSIGKEAAYRRIRSEVPFTIDEIAKISAKYHISIDKILSIDSLNQAIFNINTYTSDFYAAYFNQIQRDIFFLNRVSKSKHNTVAMAANSMPYSFYLEFENLSKFRLYKWMYQRHNDPELSFSKMKVPADITAAHSKLADEILLIESLYAIIDRNLFSSIINEIIFFYKRNLLLKQELELLKKELFALANQLERYATMGTNSKGCEMNMYLSSVDIDAAYFYLKNDDFESARIKLYTIETIITQNPYICKTQKLWIDSLKRYSTMITQSGEIERIRFFKEQKALINALGEL